MLPALRHGFPYIHLDGAGTEATCAGTSTRGTVFVSLQLRRAESDLRTFTTSEVLGTAPEVAAAGGPSRPPERRCAEVGTAQVPREVGSY